MRLTLTGRAHAPMLHMPQTIHLQTGSTTQEGQRHSYVLPGARQSSSQHRLFLSSTAVDQFFNRGLSSPLHMEAEPRHPAPFTPMGITLPLPSSNERKARALSEANKILLPLIGGARSIAKVVEAAGASQRTRPVSVHSSRDMRLHAIVVEIPGSNPLVVAVYASTQESRPTSPLQFSNRVKRLQRFISKLRGKYFNTADIAYIYISPSGLTRGARLLALKYKVFFALNGNEARQKLAKFLASRYRKLIASLQGKHIWGVVPLLLYSLSLLARKLGAQIHSLSPIHAIEWSRKGVKFTPNTITRLETYSSTL